MTKKKTISNNGTTSFSFWQGVRGKFFNIIIINRITYPLCDRSVTFVGSLFGKILSGYYNNYTHTPLYIYLYI